MGFGHSAVGIKPAEQRSIDGARIFFDTIALFGGSLRSGWNLGIDLRGTKAARQAPLAAVDREDPSIAAQQRSWFR